MSDRQMSDRRYYQAHKERIKKQQRENYHKNKEKWKARAKKYYQNNRKKMNAAKVKWRKNNPEKWNAIVNRYRRANKDRINAMQKNCYYKNREKRLVSVREYYAKNRDKINARNKERYRVKKAGLEVGCGFKIYRKCPDCLKIEEHLDFYVDKSRSSGRSGYCKKCRIKRSKKTRKKSLYVSRSLRKIRNCVYCENYSSLTSKEKTLVSMTKSSEMYKKLRKLYQRNSLSTECYSDFRGRMQVELMKKCACCLRIYWNDEFPGIYDICKNCTQSSNPLK